MEIKERIQKLIEGALKERGVNAPEGLVLEHPAELAHGDFASNAALVCAKETGGNPRELAEEFVRYIVRHKTEDIASVEAAGPGFINFHLAPAFFTHSVARIREAGARWGSSDAQTGEKVIVEYTDPNPFKEFHLGHLMNNTIGESLARIAESGGAEVKRANYQGDLGVHVACALWGAGERNVEEMNVKELGEAYARGASAYKEDAHAKQEIDELNSALYEGADTEARARWSAGREISLAYFETLYERLGTKFDLSFFESEVWERGVQLVKEHTPDVFEESEGAVVFRGERHGLHTRVFINSRGLPTYEAKELGLSMEKYDRYPYERSVVVTAGEVTEYFKVVLEALRGIAPELAEKTRHVTHGLLRLTSGKMSSRTGDIIAAETLLDELKARALQVMKEPDEQVADQVAVAAVKYAVLKQNTGRDIVFDPERSLSFEGDSGPYLQYALVRARAVVRNAEEAEIAPSAERGTDGVHELERLLYRFPDVVARARREYEPHHITTFLTECAAAFNRYYGDYRVVGGENAGFRRALTESFTATMERGLWLLGIPAPDRM